MIDEDVFDYPNFTREEIACPCCDKMIHDKDAMLRLQTLRNLVDRALHINSAVRCAKHNGEVGGGKRSQHLLGKAFDIDLTNWDDDDRELLVKEARTAGFTGYGYYNNFLHVDTGPARYWGTPIINVRED